MLPRVASWCTLWCWGLLGAVLAQLLLSESPTFSHHPLTLETSVGKVPRSWEGCRGSVHLCINGRFLGAHHLALYPRDLILHSPVNDHSPLPLFSLNHLRELLETKPSFFCPSCSNDSSYFSSTSQCTFLNYLAIIIDILPTVMLGGFPVPKKHDSSCTEPPSQYSLPANICWLQPWPVYQCHYDFIGLILTALLVWSAAAWWEVHRDTITKRSKKIRLMSLMK